MTDCKVSHVFEDKIYLLTNHVVAGNPLFYKPYYCKRFLEKLDFYLSPYCEVLSFGLLDTEFQVIVKLKERSSFIQVYRRQRKRKNKSFKKVPHSGYIFSQAMANLQSSTAIHFNRKEKRTGAVFARRYKKILVKDIEELKCWQKKLSNREKIHVYKKRWQYDSGGQYFRRWKSKNGKNWYLGSEGGGVVMGNIYRVLSSFRTTNKKDLQGHFKNPPPKQVSKKERILYLKIRHNFPLTT